MLVGRRHAHGAARPLLLIWSGKKGCCFREQSAVAQALCREIYSEQAILCAYMIIISTACFYYISSGDIAVSDIFIKLNPMSDHFLLGN
jgi:hypothetical protein